MPVPYVNRRQTLSHVHRYMLATHRSSTVFSRILRLCRIGRSVRGYRKLGRSSLIVLPSSLIVLPGRRDLKNSTPSRSIRINTLNIYNWSITSMKSISPASRLSCWNNKWHSTDICTDFARRTISWTSASISYLTPGRRWPNTTDRYRYSWLRSRTPPVYSSTSILH